MWVCVFCERTIIFFAKGGGPLTCPGPGARGFLIRPWERWHFKYSWNSWDLKILVSKNFMLTTREYFLYKVNNHACIVVYTCFIVCMFCLNALIQISRFYETAKCDEFLFDANRICYIWWPVRGDRVLTTQNM